MCWAAGTTTCQPLRPHSLRSLLVASTLGPHQLGRSSKLATSMYMCLDRSESRFGWWAAQRARAAKEERRRLEREAKHRAKEERARLRRQEAARREMELVRHASAYAEFGCSD